MKEAGRIFGWVTGLVLMLCSASAWAEVVVIGHPGIAADSLTTKQVAKLWLGKSKRIAGGGKVKVVDQQPGNAVRNEFNKKVLKKSDSQLKSYWAKVVFTGKGVPPKALADDAAVKEWVLSTPDGLGYVDSGSVDDKVKVLLRLP